MTQMTYTQMIDARPTDEYLDYHLQSNVTKTERVKATEVYKKWLLDIRYYITEPSFEYLGDHYVNLILNHVIPSSKSVYKACERHVYMLEQSKDPDCEYFFDIKVVERYLYYAQKNFRFNDDVSASVIDYVMQPVQHFVEGSKVGWRYKVDNSPVITEVQELWGRGSTKTTKTAPYVFNAMTEPGKTGVRVQYFAGARTQSQNLFNKFKTILDLSNPILQKRFKATHGKIRDIDVKKETYFELATTNADALQGGATSLLIVDEVHTLDNKMKSAVNTIRNSGNKRGTTQTIFLSTRSMGYSEYLEELVEEGKKGLEEYKETNEYINRFYYYAEIEDINDIVHFSNWVKANPMIMVQNIPALMTSYAKHIKNPLSQEAVKFFTEQFNFIDVTSNESFLTINTLKKNKKVVDMVDYLGRDAYIGIDLGGEEDFTYVATVIPNYEGEKKQLIVEGKGFITESNYRRKIADENGPWVDLKEWVDQGIVVLMPDHQVNESEVVDYVVEQTKKYNVKKISWDRSKISEYVEPELEKLGWRDKKILDVPTRRPIMSQYYQSIHAIFEQGGVIYNRDPLIHMMLRNTRKTISNKGIWVIGKSKSTKTQTSQAKIDATVAITVAYAAILDDKYFYKSNPSRGGVAKVPIGKLYRNHKKTGSILGHRR